ncbi:MAG: 2-amino-4-hydroxy-6-hydroxymethyldihydropteridine diphosphokinase [Tuberibacillus sp.]
MYNAWLGLGSNIGDREEYLYEALKMLEDHPAITLEKCSSIYETEPYGPVEQAAFLNMVVIANTSLSAKELLKVTQAIELKLKRERLIRWGPRTIDLDILAFADKMIETDTLIVPHPEITKRLFVLVPMSELDPSFVLPGDRLTIGERLKGFGSIKGVRVWKQNNGAGEYGLFEN